MINDPSRRAFLWTAPLAAAVSIPLTDRSLFAAEGLQGSRAAAPAAFQLFTGKTIAEDAKILQATPGNNSLYDPKTVPFAVVLTTEEKKSAKEFEWHEGRDHIVQILSGSTVYEVGGTPKNGRNVRAGEWLAPTSEGSTSMTLGGGDMLMIPRGTPHRRSTVGSVTFLLISPSGKA